MTRTPGKFYVEDDGGDDDVAVSILSDHIGGPIARVINPYDADLSKACARAHADFERNQRRDNARLFAASPELLEAAREVIRFVDSCGNEHIARAPFAALRAAILKASKAP